MILQVYEVRANLASAVKAGHGNKSDGKRERLVAPSNFKHMVSKDLHILLGHESPQKLRGAASNMHWWPSSTNTIRDFCRACPFCGGFHGIYPYPTAYIATGGGNLESQVIQ